jgi:hypothetical protein
MLLYATSESEIMRMLLYTGGALEALRLLQARAAVAGVYCCCRRILLLQAYMLLYATSEIMHMLLYTGGADGGAAARRAWQRHVEESA